MASRSLSTSPAAVRWGCGAAAALALLALLALLAPRAAHPRAQPAVLTTYMPPSLRWTGWLDSFPKPGAPPPPPALARPEYVGAPEDWRDNIQYGFHVDEARVPEDEEQDAMQTLMNAAGGGEAVPASEAKKAVERQNIRSKRITEARVEASKGASPQQLARILHPCEDNPSDLRCSEYPAGQLTPEYDKAKFGSSIKVPNGAIRNVAGSAEDTDGRRASAPESEFDYEVRSLTANYEDQESPQRRSKDGFHDGIDAEDPMGKLQNKKLVPLHEFERAKYGPGIKQLDMKRAGDHQRPILRSRQPATSEFWKAKFGPYGVYPFERGDSDDTMAFGSGSQARPAPLGQEYLHAKYGSQGVSMFDLRKVADSEGGGRMRLAKRQWHAEGAVRERR